MRSDLEEPTAAASSQTDLGRDHEPAPPEPALLQGRYVLVEKIGEGGMSRVYRAYDPRLEREVALKFLRPTQDASAAKRIVREARAMAKLSHPNVLPVYDVSEDHGGPSHHDAEDSPQVYIVMELVRGQTLREWAHADSRAWKHVVGHFVGAARGLAAAHAEGFVHRDFKPSNVLLGDDGRIRVMDFGLVRDLEEPSTGPVTAPLEIGGVKVPLLLRDGITEHGSVMGTVPYMSPEQHQGRSLDPRSDQYSFCVALWESLTQERPFASGLSHEVLARKLAGPPDPPAGVPAWLGALLVRGLDPNPSERHASMDEIEAALVHGLQPSRRAPWVAGVVGVAVLGGLSVGLTRATAADVSPCTAGAQQVSEAWGETRRAQVVGTLEETGLPFAARTAEQVAASLDDWARRWEDGYRDACEATQVRGDASQRMLDLRMACLSRRHAEVSALTRALTDPDPGDAAMVVAKAANLAATLPSPDRCADITRLDRRVPPPDDPDVARRVDALRERLTEASMLVQTGRIEAGLAIAQDVVGRAEAIEYAPLLAEALLERSRARRDAGQREAAHLDLEAAHAAAVRSGHDAWIAAITTDLVEVFTDHLEAAEGAAQWSTRAEAWAERVSPPPPERVRLRLAIASAQSLQGHYEDALASVGEAKAVIHEHLGDDHPLLDTARNVTGIIQSNLGAQEQARAEFQRVREARVARLGEAHPAVAQTDNNIGMTYIEEHAYAEAQPWAERAVEGAAAALGEDHPEVAGYVVNLALVYGGLGRRDDERTQLERALKIQETTLGPDHLAVGRTLMNLGTHHASGGDPAAARPHFARARDVLVHALGPEHAQVGLAEALIGHTDHDRERLEEAQRHYERALEIYAQALPPDHAWPVSLRHSLIGLLHERGDDEQALAELAHQRATFERESTRGLEFAAARLELAKLVWSYFPDERGYARTLAEDAATLAQTRAPDLAAAATAWLDGHQAS